MADRVNPAPITAHLTKCFHPPGYFEKLYLEKIVFPYVGVGQILPVISNLFSLTALVAAIVQFVISPHSGVWYLSHLLHLQVRFYSHGSWSIFNFFLLYEKEINLISLYNKLVYDL